MGVQWRLKSSRGFLLAIGCLMAGLLVEADYVSSRVAEPRGDFGRIHADGLHEFAPVGDDGVNRRGDTVDHDVDQQPGRCRRRPAEDPRPAHCASCIVERNRAVAPLPDPPAEDFLVELGRATDIDGGDFDVADLAVCQCRRHLWAPEVVVVTRTRIGLWACSIEHASSAARPAERTLGSHREEAGGEQAAEGCGEQLGQEIDDGQKPIPVLVGQHDVMIAEAAIGAGRRPEERGAPISN